jgi:acetyl-CoA acetyltransferase
MIMFFSLSAATMFAAQSIQLGSNDIVVAGGMESMSNAPKYIAEARSVYCSSGCIRM